METSKKDCKGTGKKNSEHCKQCHTNFDDFQERVDHKCQNYQFLCTLCSDSFDVDYKLNIHMRTIHSCGSNEQLDDQNRMEMGESITVNCKVCNESSDCDGSISFSHDEESPRKSKDENLVKRKNLTRHSNSKEGECHVHKSRISSGSNTMGDFSTVSVSGQKKPPCESTPSCKETSKQPSKDVCDYQNTCLETLTMGLPDNEYAILLHNQSSGSNYKCAKCNKVSRGYKLAAYHYACCKSSKSKKFTLPTGDIRWVCTYCNSLFILKSEFLKHKKVCSESSLQISSIKKTLLATVKESLDKSYQPFMKGCPKCHDSCVPTCKNKSCKQLRRYIASCVVSIQKLPPIDIQLGSYIYECMICKIVFTDNRLYSKHMETLHNHFEVMKERPLFLPPSINATKRIKTEISSTEHSPVNNEKSQNSVMFEMIDAFKKKTAPSSNEFDALNYLSRGNLNNSSYVPSSQNAEDKGDTLDIAESFKYYFFNLLISCKCHKDEVVSDRPCVECLESQNITEVQEKLYSIFKDLNNRENPHSSLPGATLITPPVSHTGLTPPPTPDISAARVQNSELNPNSMEIRPTRSPTSKRKWAGSDDEEIMDELQVDPEPDQPGSSEVNVDVVHVKNEHNVDAYAMVSVSDPNKVEKYVCFHCFGTCNLETLPNHVIKNHNLKRDVITALYVVNHDNDETDHHETDA